MKISTFYHPWTLFVAGILTLSFVPFHIGEPVGYMFGLWGGAFLVSAFIRLLIISPDPRW
jgi:hypothetical protein